jgi:hypothetical protein
MTLIATWFSEGRQAQHPPDPRYPLGYRLECRSAKIGANRHRISVEGGR